MTDAEWEARERNMAACWAQAEDRAAAAEGRVFSLRDFFEREIVEINKRASEERQKLTLERDEAREAAMILAHAYENDNRPPMCVVEQAKSFKEKSYGSGRPL